MRPRPVFVLSALAGAVLLLAAHRASTMWGDHGHRLAAAAAVQALPAEMPAFFRAAGDQLIWLDPDPDRWRDFEETKIDPALNGANAPDHYVDFEWTTEGSLRAPNRYAFLDSLRAAGQTQLPGFLPFRIVELTQRLRIQFRNWRRLPEGPEKRFLEQRIINDAGVLGHYVTDGANPHHTTIHHNGWVGANPDSFPTDLRTHARFESVFVGAKITPADVAPRMTAAPQLVAPLRDGVLGYLRTTHGELRTLYTLDKQERFSETTQGTAHRAFAATRLAAGATMLRDLWWTAWATSTLPETPPARR
ncbi:MAG: hypothetical protein MUF53_02625 [Gemmatimonadaceae bacterium]|jgi:hypothetical protein|nr:hypothetical protein [Gemmatimonadaceae bacterium]